MRLLRSVLLVAMILLVVVLGGLFLLGRSSGPTAESAGVEPQPAPAAELGADEAVLSEGFDYEQQVDGRPVFRLQGDLFTTGREGRVSLQGVRLRLYRADDELDVASERAVWDPDSQAASLEGAVRVVSRDGYSIEAERLDMPGGGREIVTSGGRAIFAYGETWSGGSESLRYELDEERLLLDGEVLILGGEAEESEPFGMVARKAIWDRAAGSIRASGRVHLSWGESTIAAQEIDAVLADGGGLASADARDHVEGRFFDASGRVAELEADGALVGFDAAGGRPSRVVLTAAPGAYARVTVEETGGGEERFSAPELRVELQNGSPQRLEAEGGVVFEERPGHGPGRLIRGRRVTASFAAAGGIESALVEEAVHIKDAELTAWGQRMILTGAGDRVELAGAPAIAQSAQGEMSAPVLVYERTTGRIRATGGVRAELVAGDVALPSADDSERDEPIRVDASEAILIDAPRGFEFTGSVQAVQGATLLFADRLRGGAEPERIEASGKVRTIWNDAGENGSEPVSTTIQAEQLEYERDSGRMRYLRSVRVRQQEREIASDECLVELDSEQRARRLIATGAVRVRDLASGRRVRGDRAEYDLESRSAVVTGAPVEIREGSGTVLRGRRALFDLATGAARLLSEAP